MTVRIYACDWVGAGTSDPFDPCLPAIDAWCEQNGVIWHQIADARLNPADVSGTILLWVDVTDAQHLAIITDTRITEWQDADPLLPDKVKARVGERVALPKAVLNIAADLNAQRKARVDAYLASLSA